MNMNHEALKWRLAQCSCASLSNKDIEAALLRTAAPSANIKRARHLRDSGLLTESDLEEMKNILKKSLQKLARYTISPYIYTIKQTKQKHNEKRKRNDPELYRNLPRC